MPVIEHDELVQMLSERSCVLVDVREPHEFDGGHIPGALNHPLSQFEPADIAQGKPLILICQAGGRSAKALGHAVSVGRQGVRHYAAGMIGWRARGGPVT